jgi:hypothetical protein
VIWKRIALNATFSELVAGVDDLHVVVCDLVA